MAHIVRHAARDSLDPPTSNTIETDRLLGPRAFREQRREEKQKQVEEQKQLYQPTPWTSPRSLKQASLYFAGATFLTASILLTRRTINKRRLAHIPARFTPSNQPPIIPPSGAVDAIEALNLATLNVTAFGIMLVGGLRWAFDVSTMEDAKRLVRGGLGIDGTGRSEGEAEEEFEEWLATVLERKNKKEEERRRREEEGGEPRNRDLRKWINERGKER